ncbi:hypothetical protein ABFS83_11G027200 [Erythranthe nasuta]
MIKKMSYNNSTIVILGFLLLINLAIFSHTVESKELLFDQAMLINQTASFQGRKWTTQCPHAPIQISQGTVSYNGVPRFLVMITNLCTDCLVARVHLHCGWFASVNLVNPNDFKRINYDDCLVNGGRPIGSGHVIEFQYSNTRPYPLSLASFVCSY